MEQVSVRTSQTIVDALESEEREIRVARGAHLQYLLPLTKGFAAGRTRRLVLAGDGATASILGLYVGHGQTRLRLTFNTIHEGANTVSRSLFKGVLLDRSTLDLDGVIRLESSAHGADALLEERALLLSPDAQATAIPSLEIEANDVRCKHAATAGPVDPEQLFYLRSRGLDERTAERLIVLGFFDQVIGQMPKAWQSTVRSALTKALQSHA